MEWFLCWVNSLWLKKISPQIRQSGAVMVSGLSEMNVSVTLLSLVEEEEVLIDKSSPFTSGSVLKK